MKRLLFFLFFLANISLSKAQLVTIANETFENPLSGWTITPTGYWDADTNLYAGGHTSYHGYVPIGSHGDTVVLTSPLYDFSGYGYVFLSFNQICKVSASDMSRIEYRENSMSSTWKSIPTSSYKGEGKYINAQFNHGSYLDWLPGDSLAIPTNNWWKTETFDISDEVSFAQVQFRFIITKGSVAGTHFAYGWLIDNFQLTASVNPISPPVVEFITNYGDTVYNTGPFEIKAKVASRTYAPILIPTLYYSTTFNSVTTNDSIAMTAVEGDSIWTATIPQYVFGTSIAYYIIGYDSVGNTNSANGGFNIKRATGGDSFKDSIMVGSTSSSGGDNCLYPFAISADSAKTRSLYLSSELGGNTNLSISRIAFYTTYNFTIYKSLQKCYLKAVTDNALTPISNIDPVADGATLVYSGSWTTQMGWNKFEFNRIFTLPAGMNLMVYMVDESGTCIGSDQIFWKHETSSVTRRESHYWNRTCGTTSTNSATGFPIAIFYFGSAIDDSNSVALHAIKNPGNTVLVNPSVQTPVIVTIKNKGIADLDSCYIDWTLNGTPQSRFTWRGKIPADFNASDTIGYYTPVANQWDTIVIWTSLPNGVYDSTTYDDTLMRIVYGISGLDLSFITLFGDTVYNTGPFTLQALIASRTLTPVPTPVNLHLKYTYNGSDTYDTITMIPLGNDKYSAVIPQHAFGTDVSYSITLTDSLGNICSISDGFYIKRTTGGYSTKDSIMVGSTSGSGGNNCLYPFVISADSAKTRSLYLSSELGGNANLSISGIAFYTTYNFTIYKSIQKCYLKAVTDNALTPISNIDPIADGATLVYSGSWTTQMGWNKFEFNRIFTLPAGMNLIVYMVDESGTCIGSDQIFWKYETSSVTRRESHYWNRGCGTTSTNSTTGFPIAIFYLGAGGIDDSNSVALYRIENPMDTVFVSPSVQIPVVVTIKNKGIADLDSCYIDWTLNGIPQPRFTWRGHLPGDFEVSDTIGFYTPQVNQYDTIVLWTSLPNGMYDSTSYDDTLVRITYGMSGLDMYFLTSYGDTLTNTGPFPIHAYIASLTPTSVPSPILLHVKYTYNGIDSYDTLSMDSIGNNIYKATIPQLFFGTNVYYFISLTDILGNQLFVSDSFFIKRENVGCDTSGYFIVGDGTTAKDHVPFWRTWDYSWSKSLYLDHEIKADSCGGTITHLAFNVSYVGSSAPHQKCYMKAVNQEMITSPAWVDPEMDGSILVWSGTYAPTTTGWYEIALDNHFVLPSHMNLLISWIDSNGAFIQNEFEWLTTNTSFPSVVADWNDTTFPAHATPILGGIEYYRPNARFHIEKTPDNIHSVALIKINNPGKNSTVGNNPVVVTIKNKGIQCLDSCVIHWTLNGVLQPPYVYKGHLPEDCNDTITIGNYNQRSNMYDSLTIWVSLPNGEIDSTNWDDTLHIYPYGCFGAISGDLIVGTAPGANFPSMADAFFIIPQCGVSGNITLKLQSGIYDENWNFSNLSTIMGNYTLTITSESGNRNSVVLKPASGVGVVINKTDNLIIKDICIDNTSSASYGIQFTGTATNIELRNIYFKGDTVGTSSSNSPAPIYRASTADLVDDIRIIGNVIEGGYYGIYFYGGNSTSAYGTHVVMDSNIIKSQYYYGGYLYYIDFSSLSNNTILSRTANTGSIWYGFRIYYSNFIADGNKIHQLSSNITQPRLTYIYYAGYYNAIGPSLFCNNELIGSSTSTYYGMYLGSYNQLNIYNNSIYMSGSGASRNIYMTNTSTSVYDIKNNIIVNASTGHPIYVAGTSTIFTSDYNCLYGNSYVGYLSSAHSTLASWQTATTQDANSVSVNPPFINVNNNLEMFDYSAFIVPRLTEVPNDINGIRRTKLSMMGAYSVPLFEGYDLKMESILSQEEVNDIHCYSDFTNIQVVIKNVGTEHYYFNTDAIKLTVEVSGAIQFKKDTLINIGLLKAAMKDTFEITNVLPVTIPGIYDIITYVSSALDTLYDDDTLRTSYGIHKIQLPYETDFSLPPAEILMKQVKGTACWEVEPGTGDNPAIAPAYGTGRLTFHSESGAGSIARAVFNGINLLGTHQPKLEFWYAHDNSYPTKRDFVAIKISTDGINTQLLDAVYRYDQTYTTPGWAYYTIDLSAYVNEPCVSLIFEGNSYGGANQNIDRIRISSSPDISLAYLSPKVADLVACNLDNQTVKVILSNLTSQRVDFDVDTTNIHFHVSGADTFSLVYPLNGIIYGLEKDTIALTHVFDFSRTGIYDMVAYVDAVDGNTFNDTAKFNILINPDLSVQEITGIDEIHCKHTGDSVYVGFKIINMGNLIVNEIPITLQINGFNTLTDTLYQRLEPGDYIQYAFTKPYVVPVVSEFQPYYYVKILTGLPCDALTSNNIKEILACVDVGEVIDLKVQSVNHPLETPCDSGLHTVNVSVTLANEGNVDINDAVVHVEVDSSGQLHASFSETTNGISAKSTITHIFTQNYLVPNQSGNYKLKVYVENISDDNNPDNDSLEINPCAIKEVGMVDYEENNWSMGQNIPNPAKGSVDIPFSIPQTGNLQFTIRSINGQILYTRNIQGIEGNNTFTYDITTFADGIYYYSMEYQGQRIIKKMTILH